MTIAIGVLTHESILFVADSEENDTVTKMDVGKIAVHANMFRDEQGAPRNRAVMVTGAGNSGFLTYLREEIIQRFKDDEPSIKDFEVYLKKKMQGFHRIHIPLGPPGTTVELIVAAQSEGERMMWVTHFGTVRRVSSYAVVGLGNTWARKVMDGFIPALGDDKAATAIATYAAFTAKQHADDCGMDTSVYCIRRATGMFRVAEPSAIKTLEDYFRKYDYRERMARHAVMGMASIQTGMSLRNIESFMMTMRQDIAALDFYPGGVNREGSPDPPPTTGAQ